MSGWPKTGKYTKTVREKLADMAAGRRYFLEPVQMCLYIWKAKDVSNAKKALSVRGDLIQA